MIKYNKKDKFLTSIISPLYELELYKSIGKGRDMHIYGVSRERGYDIYIPSGFPDVKNLVKFFQSKGFEVTMGCPWDMGENYNFQVIGLGYNLRKDSKENAKKVIMHCYLALNNQLTFE